MDPQLKRVLSQALRVEILERIATAPASPRQIADATGEPLARIAYHTSVLHQASCIRPSGPADAEPGSDCVYEIATLLPAPPRLPLSDSTRGQVLATVLRRIVERGAAALEAGALGQRSDNRVSCEAIAVDQRGWEEVQTIFLQTAERIAEASSAAAERLARSGEPGTPATVALAVFESARSGAPPA